MIDRTAGGVRREGAENKAGHLCPHVIPGVVPFPGNSGHVADAVTLRRGGACVIRILMVVADEKRTDEGYAVTVACARPASRITAPDQGGKEDHGEEEARRTNAILCKESKHCIAHHTN